MTPIITLSNFIARNNGHYIEIEDSSNSYQCFDLAFLWLDMYGIPREAIRHLYAYQIFTNPNNLTHEYFDIIPNDPVNTPSEGDFVILGPKYNGGAGDVCIALSDAQVMQFQAFGQNDPLKSPAHIKLRSYNFVLGWLHVK